MRMHPQAGARLAAPLAQWLGPWFAGIVEHHERYDGTGYPWVCPGDQISPAGRAVAVVDAYETMTAARTYKAAVSAVAARAELTRCAGSQFDPAMVRAFLGIALPRLLWSVGPLAFFVNVPGAALGGGRRRPIRAGVVDGGQRRRRVGGRRRLRGAAGVPGGPGPAAHVEAHHKAPRPRRASGKTHEDDRHAERRAAATGRAVPDRCRDPAPTATGDRRRPTTGATGDADPATGPELEPTAEPTPSPRRPTTDAHVGRRQRSDSGSGKGQGQGQGQRRRRQRQRQWQRQRQRQRSGSGSGGDDGDSGGSSGLWRLSDW